MLKINRMLTVAAFALMTAVAAPALAADQAPPAQPAAPAASSATPAVSRVEARIKELHDKLHITDAQADQWGAVAQVMRDNAKNSRRMFEDKADKAATMTAVESLRAYQQIAESHAENVKKLADAFATLYDTMSPEQKKITDDVFRGHHHRRHHHGRRAD